MAILVKYELEAVFNAYNEKIEEIEEALGSENIEETILDWWSDVLDNIDDTSDPKQIDEAVKLIKSRIEVLGSKYQI